MPAKMKGFIDIRNAPAEQDNNTYFVNISAIVYFHAIEAGDLAVLYDGKDEALCPKTFVVVNASDFDGTQMMFRIAETAEVFAARLSAAMS